MGEKMSVVTSLGSAPPPGESIVVIVMGTFAPQSAERSLVYATLANAVRELGYHTVVMSLRKFGLGDFAATLDDMEARIFGAYPDNPIILIGHSQGGSVVHALAHRRPERTVRVFAISPPTHGTHLASSPVSRWVPIARHLGAHSPQMREIRAYRDYPAEKIHVFYSPFDEFVVPFASSQVRGANNVLIVPRYLWPLMMRLGQRASQGITLVDGYCEHLSIVRHPAVLERVVGALEREPAAA